MKQTMRPITPVLFLAGFLVAASTQALSYSVVFGNTSTGAGTAQLGSPHAGSSTPYRNVTSKYNQPRVVFGGTNPHRGTDLASSFGTPVYALWDGWVTGARSCSASSGRCEIDMYIDLNRDGLRNDNLHVRFDHISTLKVTSGRITKGQWVANSGDENGAFPAHLHFGLRKDLDANGTSDVWIRNEPYYRHISSPWASGRRLDFISLSTYSSNTGAVRCYAADETSQYHQVAQGDVVIFHRRTGTSAWSSTVATRTDGIVFSVNFGAIYPSGTSIQWMARCSRTQIKNSGAVYWAFHPPKFAQPAFDPNSTAFAYDYFTSTVN